MAGLAFRVVKAIAAAGRIFAKPPPDRRDALSVLEDMDRCRNLNAGVAIASFFVAAGIGMLAFFEINDALLWAGISNQVAFLLISLSWALIFPIWALVFLMILFVLGAMGIKDVRAVLRQRLAARSLGRDQLRELRAIVASRRWRHRRIFERVLADLTRERRAS